MGEISFNYQVNTEPIQEAAFKYWFSESIEYSFAYQRYIAFSDASIFNSPVAITKVATGLSQLHWLFADKTTGELIYTNLIKSLQKSREFTRKESILFNKRQKLKLDIINNINVNNIRSGADIYANSFNTTKDGNVLNIYSHLLSSNADKDVLNVHQQVFAITNKNKINIIENIKAEKVNDFTTNIYEILLGNNFELKLNVIKNQMAQIYDIKLNTLQNTSLSSFDNIFNVNENINVSSANDIILNKLEMHFGSRNILELNALSNILTKKADVIHCNIIKQVNAKLDNIQNIIIQDFVMGYQFGRVGSYFNDINSALRSIRPSIKFDDISNVTRELKQIFSAQQYLVDIADKKHCHILNNVTASKDLKELALSPAIYVSKNIKIASNNKSLFITCDSKPVHSTNNLLPINKDRHSIDVYKQLFIDKDRYGIDLFTFTMLNKDSDKMMPYHNQDAVVKDEFSMKIYKSTLRSDKDKKESFNQSENYFLIKNKHFINEALNDIFIKKINKDALIRDCFNGINKNSHNEYLFTDMWMDKNFSDMSLLQHTSVNKNNYYMSLLEQCSADIENRRVSIFKQGQQFIKNLTTIEAPDFDFVIKNNIPANYSNVLSNGFAGMIIPISKVKTHAYIDRIDKMIQKVSKDGFIHQDLFISTIPKKISKQLFELFCDKKEFDLYIDYKNTQITKSKIRAFINSDSSFGKIASPMRIDGQYWADKSPQKAWYDKQIDAYKKAQGSFLNDIFDEKAGAIKGSKNIYTNNSFFVDKKDKMCYYDYNTTWADKASVDAKIQAQLSTSKSNKEAHMFDCVSPVIKKELNGFYDYGVFGNKPIKESQLSQQINDVHKKAYDAGIRPDDFGNWGWVYEDPDPFEGGFGIDELLLPENDTRYEDFEDIIFDKENMTPRHVVKEINENTFIAKYPIRHPLPKYKDVGIDYDKSAIKLDQFYGIETSVMHDVFLKFYRIWQAKIFEFGTMTMTQSVKLMLEYLYSWIFVYFPLEKVEQALRVFRLIRWYGETSIIRNSQYIVSYEYDTLESKLNTGSCLIPNDLGEQDTMYVDAALGVIRNNPAYINNGPAYVTFEINNRKNSTFTFSLSNTIGSVNIYINDVLVDIVSKSALNLTYDLPYTGDTNIVKIEKPASHNLNSVFYIGNIKIPCCTFKELNIEFDPSLKAGNKPLNEIAKKMISYANLYEDKDAAYDIIRKGNLGVEGIQKDLQEYWKLHHQNKTKGKRLTIKEI